MNVKYILFTFVSMLQGVTNCYNSINPSCGTSEFLSTLITSV
jgi:hypothetical protein